MKKNRIFFLTVFLPLIIGCNKTNQRIAELKKKSDEYQSVIRSRKYQLTDFYSDKPIDYIEDDSVIRRETELMQYVKPYLLDDENDMSPDGTLIIAQNSIKNPKIDSAYIFRTYQFSNDDKNIYFDFVDYFYKPLRYKVSSMDSSHILIYIDWVGGAKLYSIFKQIP